MKWILSAAVVLQALSVNGLTDYVRNNVRKNFGEDRFISIHVNEVTDLVSDIFQIHSHDQFGHKEGYHHIKLSPAATQALIDEGVEFEDQTEGFLSEMERNLQSGDFVCDEGAEACAARPSEEFFTTYHTIDTLYQRYENLHNANPSSTRWETLGLSHEGREQKLLWIGDDGDKPLVYHFCAIHAREWIGPLYCVHLAESLLDPTNEQAQNLLKKFSFVITPIGNPDGYSFTHTDDNFWRKTRKPNEGSNCFGTDPNRNYGYEWGGQGAGTSPCSETYRGTAPFDQPETFNIKTFTDIHKDRLIHINDVHSYGEYYLSAWAYTDELPPAEDYVKMEATNTAMFNAIKDFSGREFKIGPTATTIYPASGGSMDYFYGVNGIMYSGTYEARGSGFQPSTSEIKPSNAELFAGTYGYLSKILEIEFCSDATQSNIFWESADKDSNELVMASCGELMDYCSVYPVVAERCAISCGGCFDVPNVVSTNALVISASNPENGPTDVATEQAAGYVSAIVVLAGLLAIAVIGGAMLAFKLNKLKKDEPAVNVNHYNVAL